MKIVEFKKGHNILLEFELPSLKEGLIFQTFKY